MFVLDASVILKWFVEENGTKEALQIRQNHIEGKYTLVVPDIAIYEVGNALRYKPDSSAAEVSRYCRNLYELNLDIIALPFEIIDSVIETAYQNDITFYDASYVALAKELGLQFITADEKLYQKTKDLRFVKLL